MQMFAEGEVVPGMGRTLAIVGCGAMGSAILNGILKSTSRSSSSEDERSPFTKFVACVQSNKSETRLRTAFSEYSDRLDILCGDNLKAFQMADAILLACKPYMAEAILNSSEVREALRSKLLISILPGLSTADISQKIYGSSSVEGANTDSCYIINAMPNIAAQIGESMTLISKSERAAPEVFTNLTAWIFNQVGQIRYVSEEVYTATAVLAGATPAFFTIAFDGILDGAVSEGIRRNDAREMLAQSLLGLAKMIQAGEHPAIIRENVCSPKGISIRGVLSLEKESVRSAFSQAYIDSVNHGRK